MDMTILFPTASSDQLKSCFVGKDLSELPAPFAVIDKHIASENCRKMEDACKQANVLFRAHVKTSKCVEVAALEQAVEKHVNYIVSTVAEAEFMKDFFLELIQQGRTVNVLYGFPIAPSFVERLARLAKTLGEGSISLLIDNSAHVGLLQKFKNVAGFGPYIMFKVDAGYHRAGIPASEDELGELAAEAVEAEKRGLCKIHGVYSHSGHSYSGGSPEDGMQYLLEEIQVIVKGAEIVRRHLQSREERRLIVSVGASPSATAVQNLLGPENALTTSSMAQEIRRSFKDMFENGFSFELHAGVYSILDIQQVNIQSTRSRSAKQAGNPITSKDIALSILVEVASVYPKRSPPQALIGAGTLALGREPCSGYPGWGIVSGWRLDNSPLASLKFSGWEVGKISQEHGLLYASEDSRVKTIVEADGILDLQSSMPFKVGQKIRIWPNHACIAAANFGCYAVVDSSSNEPDRIIDVWVRCRGW